LRGRARRSCNLSTKLTADEAKAIQEAASRAGKTPSEWARDLMLSSVVVGSHTQMEMHIFTELVGIQMLLMNTLEPLLRGDKIAQEQLTILFRQVQTTKATKAQELLAKRQPEQGEIAMHSVQQWGRRESIIWPPRHYLYTLAMFR
jgi:Mobilization protein NikA